jgi:hypothetical protein
MDPNLHSSPSQVQQASERPGAPDGDGDDRRHAGDRALGQRAEGAPQTTILFIDAQTYQPPRTVQQVNGSGHVLSVGDWMAATPANIAMAKDDSIPSGYTKATPAEVY